MIIYNEKLLENFKNKNKLNVAFLTDIFYPSAGGITTLINSLAKALQKNNVNVVVITGKVKNYIDNVEYPVIRCKSFTIPKNWGDSLPLPNSDRKFKNLFKSLNLDIIHIHSVFSLFNFGKKMGKNLNIPTIYHANSKFSEEFSTTIKSKLISNILIKKTYKKVNKVNKILAVSNNTKQNYLEHKITTDIQVVPNTTDLQENKDIDKALDFIKTNYNLDCKKENVLLFVSRLLKECKNIGFILNSLSILKHKLNINFKFFIVGSGPDEEELKKDVIKLNLTDNVIFTGNINNRTFLSYFYQVSKLFLFPSKVDTSALVKFEAASQRTPTLALINTAVSEDIVDNENGFTCEEDEYKFALKIKEILEDKNKLNKVSLNAKKTLAKGWDNTAKEIIEIYKDLINKNKNE